MYLYTYLYSIHAPTFTFGLNIASIESSITEMVAGVVHVTLDPGAVMRDPSKYSKHPLLVNLVKNFSCIV